MRNVEKELQLYTRVEVWVGARDAFTTQGWFTVPAVVDQITNDLRLDLTHLIEAVYRGTGAPWREE